MGAFQHRLDRRNVQTNQAGARSIQSAVLTGRKAVADNPLRIAKVSNSLIPVPTRIKVLSSKIRLLPISSCILLASLAA